MTITKSHRIAKHGKFVVRIMREKREYVMITQFEGSISIADNKDLDDLQRCISSIQNNGILDFQGESK